MSDVAKRLEKAERYLQKGKLDAALEEYLEVLEEEPRNAEVRNKAADVCAQLGRPADAAKLLGELFDQEAAANDVAHAAITYKRLVRVGRPRLDQMTRYAQLVEKTAHKDAVEAYEAAAREYESSGKKQEALATVERLVALEPTLANLVREGELAAAVGKNKESAEAFARAGGMLKAEAPDKAVSYYRRAYELDAANADAALACAEAALAQNNFAEALRILEPFAIPQGGTTGTPEQRDAYARALLAAERPLEAEPFIRELYQNDPNRIEELVALIGGLLDADQEEKALDLARKAEEQELKRGRRREYVGIVKEMAEHHTPRVGFLEYLVEVFNSANREQDYCATLIKLFDLYYAAGRFLQAGDALDRAAEVDPYEQGHQKRLEMLRGKIEANRFNAIANRFGSAMQAAPSGAEEKVAPEGETTVLEDLMLQAEIFMQYSMRSRAVERLQRISKLFPHEEEKTQKLRQLYTNAGFLPKYEGEGAEPAAAAAAAAPARVSSARMPAYNPAAAASSAAASNEEAVDNFSRVTEITRNIYRQGSVKGVLFTAVNDIGRHWNASRCIAGLLTPGKPPSAALEYVAPGLAPSEVMAVVKRLMTLQPMLVVAGVLNFQNLKAVAELDPIRQYIGDVQSLLAVPLLDAEDHVGILILEQTGAPRAWRGTDVVVLKTIADQMALAVNNARLRSLVKTLAVTDEKSGLLKRSSYIDVLLSEVKHGIQQNSPLTLMLLQFGTPGLVREIGEAALENIMQQAGQVACSHVRQNDVAVRYDRNTIAVSLSDTNDKNAFFVVDKLRKLLVALRAPGLDIQIPLTAGIAEAVLQSRFEAVDIVTELINRAEAALDQARAAGGNNAKSLAAVLEEAAVAD